MLKMANVCYVELPESKKGLIKGKRLCMIIEEMRDGSYTPYVTAIPITDEKWRYNPKECHYKLNLLNKERYLLIDQLQTVYRTAIKSPPITRIYEEEINAINKWLKEEFNV